MNDDIEQILNEVDELRRELQAQEGSSTVGVAQEMKAILDEARSTTPGQSETPPVASAPGPVATVTPIAADAPVATANPIVESASADPLNADDLMKEFHAAVRGSDAEDEPDGGMESTLAELKEDPAVQTLLDQTLDDQARRQFDRPISTPASPIPFDEEPMSKNPSQFSPSTGPSSPSDEPTLTMSLTGSMTLKLKYEFGGQEVTVGFTDECFKIELADGTEFKIPAGRKKTLRRVA